MDHIFESWLERQYAAAMALAAASEVLRLHPETTNAPRNYVLHFDCQTVILAEGRVLPWRGCDVLVRIPADYLRVAPNPAWLVSLLAPTHLHHPNVRSPFLCLGRISPGTSLIELIYQIHEVLTFMKFTPREDDALNREACSWARRNMALFPTDTRPLRGRTNGSAA